MKNSKKKDQLDMKKFYKMPRPYCMVKLDWKDILKVIQASGIKNKDITRKMVLDVMGSVAEADATKLFDEVQNMIEEELNFKKDEEEE